MNDRIFKFLKSALRDSVLLIAVIVGIGVVQTYYFQGKDVPSAVFAETYPSLDGISRPILAPDAYTFVYAFAPWCGVCKMSASNINGLREQFHTLAVALSYERESDVRAFVDNAGLTVPVVLGQGKLEDALDVGQFPTYFILGPKGQILLGWSGYTTTVGIWLRLWGVRLLGYLRTDHGSEIQL